MCLSPPPHECLCSSPRVSLILVASWKWKKQSENVSCSVVSDSLQPHGLKPTSLLCPWNSPGKNTGVSCPFPGDRPDLGIEPGSPALQADSLPVTNIDSALKSWDITLLTKVCTVKAMVFPVIMCGCESWTIKKTECQKTDAFDLCCWRRLLRVPCTARKSNQSILKETNPVYSLEELMLKLKLQ